MAHYHAVIWIDHHEARVVEFGAEGQSSEIIKPARPFKHPKNSAAKSAGWRAAEDPEFFDEIARGLDGIGEILIVGPAGVKLAFFKRLQAKHPSLAEKVIGVETVDHPTDGELVRYAKKYFHKAERMLPQLS